MSETILRGCRPHHGVRPTGSLDHETSIFRCVPSAWGDVLGCLAGQLGHHEDDPIVVLQGFQSRADVAGHRLTNSIPQRDDATYPEPEPAGMLGSKSNLQ
jgi:hypothetical protein